MARLPHGKVGTEFVLPVHQTWKKAFQLAQMGFTLWARKNVESKQDVKIGLGRHLGFGGPKEFVV